MTDPIPPIPPTLDVPSRPVRRLDGVHRIAVLRSGGLGDLIGAEPALAALRAAYPEAEITLLGAGHHRALVEQRPGPWDRFVEVPPLPGVRGGPGPDASRSLVERWYDEQRAERYDLAVQLHGGGANSNRVVLGLGARTTAGAATRDAPKLDRWVPYSALSHDTLRWLEVASACGAPPVRLEPSLAVTARDVACALREVAADGVPLLAVHPGASHARRRWRPERLGAVADAVARRGGRVVVLGGRSDRALVDQVRDVLSVPPIVVADPGIGGLVGVLARAALFVGNDSGPRHVAAAVGTPTVGVFTNANLADVAPLTRTWHRIAVSWRSVCEVCGCPVQQPDCGHGASALSDVPVDAVVPLALELWDQTADAERLVRPAEPRAWVPGGFRPTAVVLPEATRVG